MTARYQLLDRGVFDHQTRAVVAPASAEWTNYKEWLTAGGIPLPMDSAGQDDLATAKAKRCAEINAWAAGLRNKVIAGISAGEMASWTIKLVEARDYLSTNNPAVAPLIVQIAQVRGMTPTALANRVIANAAQYQAAEAAIDGTRGKHCDAIEAMTDVRDIVAYDWRTGWPAL